MDKKEEITDLLNALFKITPIGLSEVNARKFFQGEELAKLEELEQKNPKLILGSFPAGLCISLMSILSTVTSMLIDQRISFAIDDNDIIQEVVWLDEEKE